MEGHVTDCGQCETSRANESRRSRTGVNPIQLGLPAPVAAYMMPVVGSIARAGYRSYAHRTYDFTNTSGWIYGQKIASIGISPKQGLDGNRDRHRPREGRYAVVRHRHHKAVRAAEAGCGGVRGQPTRADGREAGGWGCADAKRLRLAGIRVIGANLTDAWRVLRGANGQGRGRWRPVPGAASRERRAAMVKFPTGGVPIDPYGHAKAAGPFAIQAWGCTIPAQWC